MQGKKRYFVSVTKETITRVSIPDADEYEIYATKAEITELRRILQARENRNFLFTMRNIVFDPLASSEAEMLDEENEHLKYIYEFLYRHGTEETKEKIRSLRLIEENMIRA